MATVVKGQLVKNNFDKAVELLMLVVKTPNADAAEALRRTFFG